MRLAVLFLLFTTSSFSVMINPKGMGDALIIPYYTVNNNLNTLVTVTNMGNDFKAIKINIREGLHGYAALSYNVYIEPVDTWSFGLISGVSSLEGYEGQNSTFLISNDNSCAPFLNKTGHEFSINKIVDGPTNLSRMREGYIEIIEMATITGNVATLAADGGATGQPNCSFFETAWSTVPTFHHFLGYWGDPSTGNPLNDLSATSGGLMSEAIIVDVGEGINYSIPVIALDGFHAEDTIIHIPPDDDSLSLDSSTSQALVKANGEFHQLSFDRGIDAVSAVFMTNKLVGNYVLDPAISALSETIFTQPTRRFYTEYSAARDNVLASPPYNSDNIVDICPASSYGGSQFEDLILDRESQSDIETCDNQSPHNCFTLPALCGSVFSRSFVLPGGSSPNLPSITHSNNSMITATPSNAKTYDGTVITYFNNTPGLSGIDIASDNPIQLHGIPVIGVTLLRFTNTNASEGLLAQYGGAQPLKSSTQISVNENNP